jgi:hypothetical protein
MALKTIRNKLYTDTLWTGKEGAKIYQNKERGDLIIYNRKMQRYEIWQPLNTLRV